MASTPGAAGSSTAGGLRATTAATHHSGAADRHTADWLATVRMLRECVIFHALTDFKALGGFAFKLGDGFVNVGGHGGK
jgi:hypothetical protein